MSTVTLVPPSRTEKVRRTFTLDADLVAALSAAEPDNLSGAVNAALREAVERRERRASLVALVADLDAQFGRPSAAEIARAKALLA